MGIVLSDERRSAICHLLATSGRTVRSIAWEVGCCAATVSRLADGIERAPCGCGRSAGHKGHCSFRVVPGSTRFGRRAGEYVLWSAYADDILRRRYAAGDALGDIAAHVGPLSGRKVTGRMVRDRANKLKVGRPEGYFTARRMGRPVGSKNKRPYIRRGWRPTKPRIDAFELAVIANVSDLIFEWLVENDRDAEDAARQRQMRARDESEWRLLKSAAGISLSTVRKPRHRAPAVRTEAPEYVLSPAAIEQVTMKASKRPSDMARDTIPTARRDPATKGVPFGMSSMKGPDPLRHLKLEQASKVSLGRV